MKKVLLLIMMLVGCVMASAQPPIIKPPTPSKPKVTTGTLKITSTPSGAVVKIDGKYKGETPLTLEKQKAGTYQVSFNAEGYVTQTKSVSISAGKTATCSATLKKKQVAQATTTVTSTTSSDGSSQTFTVNGVSFKMIRVEGQGTPFYIGETEVTQALWQAVMGSNPSYFKGGSRPVEQVGSDDHKEFISRLNSLTGKIFRLPEESEWEYAAKGGNKSRGYEYSGSNNLDEVGWYDKNAYYCGSESSNSSHPDYGTHNVKTKKPNELGLYDMSGNVCEFCYDLNGFVFRGGSWSYNAGDCRVLSRSYFAPDSSHGLRLAL